LQLPFISGGCLLHPQPEDAPCQKQTINIQEQIYFYSTNLTASITRKKAGNKWEKKFYIVKIKKEGRQHRKKLSMEHMEILISDLWSSGLTCYIVSQVVTNISEKCHLHLPP
jgi:hypothetical protein